MFLPNSTLSDDVTQETHAEIQNFGGKTAGGMTRSGLEMSERIAREKENNEFEMKTGKTHPPRSANKATRKASLVPSHSNARLVLRGYLLYALKNRVHSFKEGSFKKCNESPSQDEFRFMIRQLRSQRFRQSMST